jgi:hypothetical protein
VVVAAVADKEETVQDLEDEEDEVAVTCVSTST